MHAAKLTQEVVILQNKSKRHLALGPEDGGAETDDMTGLSAFIPKVPFFLKATGVL